MHLPPTTTRPTSYFVTCLNPEYVDSDIWGATVSWVSGDQWKVTRLSQILTIEGEWKDELMLSVNSPTEVIPRTRFRLDLSLIHI